MKVNSITPNTSFGMSKLNNSIVPIKTIETTKNAINNETILLSNFIEKVKSIINIITSQIKEMNSNTVNDSFQTRTSTRIKSKSIINVPTTRKLIHPTCAKRFYSQHNIKNRAIGTANILSKDSTAGEYLDEYKIKELRTSGFNRLLVVRRPKSQDILEESKTEESLDKSKKNKKKKKKNNYKRGYYES